ncbi:SEL1-like repeat protein [Helicobacter pylori]|nr:SEL1-like repeat protein [Helicobacter pylori]
MAEPNPKELFDLGVKSIEAKDYIQAEKYFEKACDLKYGGGCSNLGVLYQNGQVVEKDLTKAAYFYSKACKLGFQKTCEILKELR